jgi:hypothetical protein
MHDLLYQFLIQHHSLNLPGIGTLNFIRKPALDDFGSKSFYPPEYSLTFDHSKETSSKKLFNWLANVFNCSEFDAIKKVNDFGFNLKQQIQSGKKVNWHGVGIFQLGQDGIIKFDPQTIIVNYEKPVGAEKVIRENVAHQVRVGEDYRTSAQMAEMLFTDDSPKKRSWWLIPLILIIIAFILTAWYFSSSGFKVGSTGLQQKMEVEQSAPLHKEIQ